MNIIPVEISARHVHLNQADWRTLFGDGAPTPKRPISQRPQFLAVERAGLRGPEGELSAVAIVGPLRPYTQVELAATDARHLGIQAPLRDSGQLAGAGEVTIFGPAGEVIRAAAIIQQRHIHAAPAEAASAGLRSGQEVSVQIDGPRGGRLDHVIVRVHDSFSWRLHLDTDEANALGIEGQTHATIIIP